ncbi:hypothetical protein CARUB_v10002045mg [Capsella rubella]|uniref:Uncharacterized protein n=1 Tax=Capsella rubella TaxID=81985 RepID=R0GXK5_9BRAS|nr:uncharacterized protein LOC17884529 [Capsella rubella]EOA21634.1 hypothetical protein CARUB_v10002045mg [Capsella rubella]
MVSSDDWTKCAMRDGQVVAELLVTLKEAKAIKNPTVSALRWGIRQPRSSQSPRKEAESRCSPSTPLSWSGGCGGSSSSPSCYYVDGYEATSRRISSVGSRSKVLVTTADLDFDVKRLQKKKDMALLRSPFSESKNLKRMKNMVENENHRKADGNFLLPDLNIMPCEESSDHCSSLGVETTLYGIGIIR